MGKGLSKILAIWRDNQSGATAIEYALLAAGIALALVFAIFGFGTEISNLMSSLASFLDI